MSKRDIVNNGSGNDRKSPRYKFNTTVQAQSSHQHTPQRVGKPASPSLAELSPDLEEWPESEDDLEPGPGDSNSGNATGPEANDPVGQRSATILVMGMTGTGKSSFIKLLTERKDIKIGDSIDPETSDISTYQFLSGGRKVELVDTPGFDDDRPHMSDTKLLKDLTNFLVASHKTKTMNGLIYLHRITDPRLGSTARRNIRMFSKLCGPAAMRNVVILTTRWDDTKLGAATKTEAQLMDGPFKEFSDYGAKALRHFNTVESARRVIFEILSLPPIHDIRIVTETMAGIPLADTAAGRELFGQLHEAKKRHVGEINALRKRFIEARENENKAQKEDLRKMRGELLSKLQKASNDQDDLEGKTASCAPQGPEIGRSSTPGSLTALIGGALTSLSTTAGKAKDLAKGQGGWDGVK